MEVYRGKSQTIKSVNINDRVSVFIDVANVIFSMHNYDWYLDYKKLFDYFKNNYNLKDIYFYTAVRKNNKKDKQFINLLRRFGYIVKSRNLKIIKDKHKGKVFKGNMDGFIFVDVVDTIGDYDVCVLFSGDSDFEVLLDYIHERNKKVVVFSTKKYCSRELREKADEYFSLQFFSKIANKKNRPE